VVAAHEAGDHWIFIGRIEAAVQREGEPLIYYGGAYRRVVESP
jgi:flavin reductase (DIM6/NTAB) family NADH-FMN oxidoreductase RutF